MSARCARCGRHGHEARACRGRLPAPTEPGTWGRGRLLDTSLRALVLLRSGRWTVLEMATELEIHWRTGYRLIRSLERAGVIVEWDDEHHVRVPADPLRRLLNL